MTSIVDTINTMGVVRVSSVAQLDRYGRKSQREDIHSGAERLSSQLLNVTNSKSRQASLRTERSSKSCSKNLWGAGYPARFKW